jgi:hypothetical protein
MKLVRISGAAIAAALAVPALAAAAPISTVLRVEGGSANILSERSVIVDDAVGATVVVNDTTDADTITVPAASATAQLATATKAAGLSLGFSIFTFPPSPPSSFITRIGAEASPPTFDPAFRVKVNNVAASVGADAITLKAGDVVTWAFLPFAQSSARELDLTVPGDKFSQGQTFTVSVRSFDDAGAGIAAAGATIRYGDQTLIADTSGRVTLLATGVGVKQVSATRSGEVRSQVRNVCSFTDDPTVCDLPAIPAPIVRPGTFDTVAPGSVIASPISGRRYATLRSLRGSAGPDRSDIANVEVAVARRVGTQCRFVGPKGGFTAARSCTNRLFIPAKSSGGRWFLQLAKPLPAGKYRAWSRAVDGAGNRESVGITTVNAISFTVLPRRSSR